MVLKSWSFAFMLFMIMLFSGVVDSIDVISPQDPMENAMSTTPIVYDNVEGSSDVSLGLVTGPTGSNAPTIEDLLPKAPTIEDRIRSGELSKGERPPTIGDQIGKLNFDKETGLLDIKKDWPSGATYHNILSYGDQESNAYQLVVIGDSIAWGNGLEEVDKYYNKVAKDLQEALKRPVEITVYAHSGAVISTSGESAEEMLFRTTGSLPDANLNKGGPTLMEQAAKISNDADLILVSGGINDVGALTPIKTNIPENDIRTRTKDKIEKPMAELLTNILDNTKTDAKIIVTGYYSLASDDTIMESQDQVVTSTAEFPSQMHTGMANALEKVQNSKNGDTLRALNSKAFDETSTTSLQNAVDDANRADNGRGRVVFVDPKFESINSYGASKSFLWELNPDGTSNDDQRNDRSIVVARNGGNPITKYENEINAIGHPNKDGASQYKEAIMGTLLDKSKGLDWLTSDTTEKNKPTVGIPKSLLKKEFLASLTNPQLSPYSTSGISWSSDQNKGGSDGLETTGTTYSDKANDVWYVDAFYWSGDRNLLEKPAAPYRFASGEINTYGYNWIFLPYSQTGIRFSPGYADWAADTLASMGISVGAGVGPLDDGQVGGGLGGGGGESW